MCEAHNLRIGSRRPLPSGECEGAIQIRGGCVEKKVLIYVRDEAYGRRLLEYLETRHSGGIDWELVTERGFERRKDEKGVWLTDDPGQTEDEDKKYGI